MLRELTQAVSVGRSNFIEEFESLWLETWRSLARELEGSYPLQWDVWSHSFGPGAHTAGIELRGEAAGYAERVYCLVDYRNCESEPTVERAELGWEWDFDEGGSGTKRAFWRPVPLALRNLDEEEDCNESRLSVPLTPENWHRLGECFEEWTLLLEPLFTTPLPVCCAGFVCQATGGIEAPPTSGQEPDFAVWRAYLETQPDTLLLAPGADESPDGEDLPLDLKCIVKALMEVEPSLQEATVKDWLSKPPLELPGFLKASRPVQFAEAPRRSEGYQGTMRQLLGRHPKATGVLHFSRVAFGNGQALFPVYIVSLRDRYPEHTFVLGTESPEGWSFRHLTVDFDALEVDFIQEESEEPKERLLPSLEGVKVPGIRRARFVEQTLEVEFENGTTQSFNVFRDGYTEATSLLEPPYIAFSEYYSHTPTQILEACVQWASSRDD